MLNMSCLISRRVAVESVRLGIVLDKPLKASEHRRDGSSLAHRRPLVGHVTRQLHGGGIDRQAVMVIASERVEEVVYQLIAEAKTQLHICVDDGILESLPVLVSLRRRSYAQYRGSV